jgi:hypothetical protein
MNKLLITIFMVLLATSVFAQSPMIGLYADEAGTVRFAGIEPYVAPLVLYAIASWPIDHPDLAAGITAVEFKFDNLPENEGYPIGTVDIENASDLLIGDFWTDYSLAFSEPQGAGLGFFSFSTLEFMSFDVTWIPEGHLVTTTIGDDCECMVLVDSVFEIHDAVGETFYFSAVAAETSTWSQVKNLY